MVVLIETLIIAIAITNADGEPETLS